MNPYLKRAAEVIAPEWLFATLRSIRSRNYQKQLHHDWGVAQATQEMISCYGLTVLNGPFKGMQYPASSLASRDGIPLLFATYELELHPVIEEVASKRYGRILNNAAPRAITRWGSPFGRRLRYSHLTVSPASGGTCARWRA